MDPAPLDGSAGAVSDEDRRSPLRAVGGLAVVLVLLIGALWLLSLTSDDTLSEGGAAEDPEDSDTLDPPTKSSPLRADVEQDGSEPPALGAAEPFSPLEGRLAYLSGTRLAFVDLGTGAATFVPLEMWGKIVPLDDLELLTDENRTVAVSLGAEPPTADMVASSAVLVPAAAAIFDYWTISWPDGPDGVIRLSQWSNYGLMSGSVVAPAGSKLVTTGDSGVLVLPPVGGTFRPTASGFESVTENRVLAAAGSVRVEQSCDEQLSCTFVALDTDSGQVAELPDGFVAELAAVSVSPDGRWLINDTDPAWLFDRRTEELRLLDVGGYGRPQWSDDSRSVAWLTTDRTPTLVVAQLDPPDGEKGWLAVELAGLDADPSPGSSFLLKSTLSPR